MAKRLTAAFVKGAEPGVYGDQFGLRLRVLPTGGRQWIWRGTVAGRRVDLGLGGYPVVTLAEARELALDCKRAAWRGNDPRAVRNRRTAPTFTEATEAAIALHAPTWKNPRTESQWRASLAAHAYPVIGRLTVDAITPADVLRVLSPIWSDKPAIAGAATDPRGRGDALGDCGRLPDGRSGRGRCRGGAAEAQRRDAAASSGRRRMVTWPVFCERSGIAAHGRAPGSRSRSRRYRGRGARRRAAQRGRRSTRTRQRGTSPASG